MKDIERQLQTLHEKLESNKLADYIQNDEDTLGLLEDLQEVILAYQVCLSLGALFDVDQAIEGTTGEAW